MECYVLVSRCGSWLAVNPMHQLGLDAPGQAWCSVPAGEPAACQPGGGAVWLPLPQAQGRGDGLAGVAVGKPWSHGYSPNNSTLFNRTSGVQGFSINICIFLPVGAVRCLVSRQNRLQAHARGS